MSTISFLWNKNKKVTSKSYSRWRINLSQLSVDENAYLSINERNCNPVEIKQSSTLSSEIVNFLQTEEHNSYYPLLYIIC